MDLEGYLGSHTSQEKRREKKRAIQKLLEYVSIRILASVHPSANLSEGEIRQALLEEESESIDRFDTYKHECGLNKTQGLNLKSAKSSKVQQKLEKHYKQT